MSKDNFRRITGFTSTSKTHKIKPGVIYGLAVLINSDTRWYSYTGSMIYILGCYQATEEAFEMVKDISPDGDKMKLNVICYELNDNLIPTDIIESLKLNEAQAKSTGSFEDQLVINNLVRLDNKDAQPFGRVF